LEVQLNSEIIRPGQKLPKGSNIDLIIGRTQGNTSTQVPDLKGLTLFEAEQYITDALLNSGVVMYDNSIVSGTDSLEARVWRQRPNPRNTSSVQLGSFIDLWLTTDSLKFNTASDAGF
jgi:eukaryotic-like serine/threonine-protein kinase